MSDRISELMYEIRRLEFRDTEQRAEIEALQATIAELQEKRIQAAVEGSDWKSRALRAEAMIERLPKFCFSTQEIAETAKEQPCPTTPNA